MNSMTGFGRAEISRKEYCLFVELASVNGRSLECVFRLPRAMAGLETALRELLAKKIERGKITVTVGLEESAEAASVAMLDFDLAAAYYRRLLQLQKKLRLPGRIEIGHIAAQPQLFSTPNDRIHEDRIWPDLQKLVAQAVERMLKMRQAEGRRLKSDLAQRLKLVAQLVSRIERRSPQIVADYRRRLAKRIKDLDASLKLDATRLAEEVTIYADRSDVTEECVRLHSHLEMFEAALKSGGVVGKKLGFIVQEMGREANTVGAKSLSGQTAALAIALKEEIEKLREQIQNIE